MYIPASFQQPDTSALHDFIQQHSFGVLVTSPDDTAGGALNASHLPLLLDRSCSPNGRLIGHMAKANDQWQAADNARVLVIFSGPHAYISPRWYSAQNVVPTWNYVAVHASGTLKLIEDPDRLVKIIRETVNTYEKLLKTPWSLDQPAPEFIDRLLPAIVGFEIDIDVLEGKWKLSQNHDADRRAGVIIGLNETGNTQDAEIATLMSRI
jgi:transcriptional regulator